jgi:hypothetical protein
MWTLNTCHIITAFFKQLCNDVAADVVFTAYTNQVIFSYQTSLRYMLKDVICGLSVNAPPTLRLWPGAWKNGCTGLLAHLKLHQMALHNWKKVLANLWSRQKITIYHEKAHAGRGLETKLGNTSLNEI